MNFHTAGRGRAGTSGNPEAVPLAAAVARNFSATYTVVAPVLALHEAGVGFGALYNRSVAANHPAVPAVVVSVAPAGGVRWPEAASTLVVAFQPAPASPSCQIEMRATVSPARLQAGSSVMVVPRSAYCEAPLLPFAAADPAGAFTLAALLLFSALGSAKLWRWLDAAMRRVESAQAQTRERAGMGLLGRRS